MYNYLFKSFYSLLRRVEFGANYETDNSRAQQTIVLVSLFELLNLMSIFSQIIRGYILVAPLALLLVINYFIFLFGDRYKKIVSINVPMEKVYKPITIIYVIGTIVFFTITR